ncbi:MAG TPA: hypothetical protein VH165_11540 [Kofleriaceae bacterium]|jgi:hypothetical protein|nr:hypothetical protein [Kofleriaceae bacterium]
MSDERTTGADEAARRGGASRAEPLSRDERLDRLVTALAEARPVLDDLTRARVGAKLAATTRKWAVGSAVRVEPDPPVVPAPATEPVDGLVASDAGGRSPRAASARADLPDVDPQQVPANAAPRLQVPADAAPRLAVRPKRRAHKLRGRTWWLSFAIVLVLAGTVAAALALWA